MSYLRRVRIDGPVRLSCSRVLFSSYKRPYCRRRFLHSDFGITMYSKSHETSEFTFKLLCDHNLSKFVK